MTSEPWGSSPVMLGPDARNSATGGFIVIDESTNDTVAAGMVVKAR